jgi:uncharacterized protein (TIRG00374 family)
MFQRSDLLPFRHFIRQRYVSTSKLITSANQETPPEQEAATEVAQHGFSLKERLLNTRTLVSFALAFAIIVFVFTKVDIDPRAIWAQMRQVNPWLYLLAFVSYFGTFPLRALRWRILLQNADFPIAEGRRTWASLPAMTEYIGLSWFANCVVPAKLGDAYRGYLLKHNGNVSFSRTLGTIVAERLLDMIMLFALLVLSAWSIFGTRLPPGTEFIFIFGLVLVVVIISGLATMRFLSPFIRRILPARMQHMYAMFESGTLGALKARALPSLLLLTVLVWLGESMRLFLVIEAMGGLQLGLTPIIFVTLMSSLLTTIPATPGGLAIVEGGMVTVLTSSLFGVAAPVAAAVALLDRVISYWAIVIFGFVLYLVSKRK